MPYAKCFPSLEKAVTAIAAVPSVDRRLGCVTERVGDDLKARR